MVTPSGTVGGNISLNITVTDPSGVLGPRAGGGAGPPPGVSAALPSAPFAGSEVSPMLTQMFLPSGFQSLTPFQQEQLKAAREAMRLQKEAADYQKYVAGAFTPTGTAGGAMATISKFLPVLGLAAGATGIAGILMAMLKESQIIRTATSTIVTLLSALVDIILLPLVPILVPVLQSLGKVIAFIFPVFQALSELVQKAIDALGGDIVGVIRLLLAPFTFALNPMDYLMRLLPLIANIFADLLPDWSSMQEWIVKIPWEKIIVGPIWEKFIVGVIWEKFIVSPIWDKIISAIPWEKIIVGPVWEKFIVGIVWEDIFKPLANEAKRAWDEIVALFQTALHNIPIIGRFIPAPTPRRSELPQVPFNPEEYFPGLPYRGGLAVNTQNNVNVTINNNNPITIGNSEVEKSLAQRVLENLLDMSLSNLGIPPIVPSVFRSMIR